MDAATLNQHLEKHLRVNTFPLAIKSLKPGDPLPEKVKIPSKHLGVKVAICQAISIARRYGWTMAFSGADLSCPIAKAAFGFEERNDYYTSGGLADGMYASCREAGARFEEALVKYDAGEYAAMLRILDAWHPVPFGYRYSVDPTLNRLNPHADRKSVV